jgi:hypothetical protein
MTDTPITPPGGRLGLTGHEPKVDATYPWTGKPWATQAAAADAGLQGQGYIVHAVMMANRYGVPLALTVVVLMLVQIAVAVLQIVLR